VSAVEPEIAACPPKRRRTPTEKQVEGLKGLDDDALIARAIESLHSLNRRAKELRDRRNTFRRATFAKHLSDDIETIYSLKDALLEALVLAGRATVGTFEIDRSEWDEPSEHYCEFCGRSWFGDSWCYACQDDTGESIPETWYVIDCGPGFRFHQPDVSEAVAARAVEIEPHDPQQPQREIPKVGLTIAAQKACVDMATARLKGNMAKEVRSTKSRSTCSPTCSSRWASSSSRTTTAFGARRGTGSATPKRLSNERVTSSTTTLRLRLAFLLISSPVLVPRTLGEVDGLA
jgi:hypothetical protein